MAAAGSMPTAHVQASSCPWAFRGPDVHLGLQRTGAQPSAVRPEARVAPRGAEALGEGARAGEWAGARGQRRRAVGTGWQAGPFPPRRAVHAAKSGFRRD